MDILVIHCIRLQISSCRVQMTRYVAVCKVMARNINHVLLANCLFLQVGVCRCIGPILYWIQECLWRIVLMLMFYFFLSVKGLGKARQGVLLFVSHSHGFAPFSGTLCMYAFVRAIDFRLLVLLRKNWPIKSKLYWNIIEYGEFDWSIRFFVFLWWDKQPEINCTLIHKTTPIHCGHTCPQYQIEQLLWPLHYGLSSRLQYLTLDATHFTNP